MQNEFKTKCSSRKSSVLLLNAKFEETGSVLDALNRRTTILSGGKKHAEARVETEGDRFENVL